jgi:formylglycine-generating enzyme required for sulfatase activity
MQTKNKVYAVALATLAAIGGATAHANITIETVTVGNPGNAWDDTTNYGSVSYVYQIGKYEVTNAQYTTFLNAVAAVDTYGLYNSSMGASVLGGIIRSGSPGFYTYTTKAGFGNKPVVYVSFWNAARFANWLNNGQGTANTEIGSYALTPAGVAGNTVTRNLGAAWVVASEDEWYKAAFYDPTKNGGSGGYWLQATRSNSLGQNNPFGDINGANYYDGDFAVYTGVNDGALPVGSYFNAASFYGTFDQAGNASEWTDAIKGTGRSLRGGAWSLEDYYLSSAFGSSLTAGAQDGASGFRVVNLTQIPEPSTFAVILGGMALAGAMLRPQKRLS